MHLIPEQTADSRRGGAIILAAGVSRRFGSDKRQFEVRPNRPMLLETVARYCGVFPDVAVVLRRGDAALVDALQRQLAGRHAIIISPMAHLGMGHSLADAAIQLTQWHWAYAFIGLADMPFVTAATLSELDRQMRSLPPADRAAAIVQPRRGDRPGHPVGFGGDCFTGLAALEGDAGARALLQCNRERIRYVDVDDTGIHDDIDTPPATER